MRHVTLIAGPPTAGKSTWARAHVGDDGIILDRDDMARAAGSTARWHHSRAHKAAAEAMMRTALRQVAEADQGTHLVIRTVAGPTEREQLAAAIRADRVVVLLPTMEEMAARAMQRSNPQGVIRAIQHWLARYGPAPCDELLSASRGPSRTW